MYSFFYEKKMFLIFYLLLFQFYYSYHRGDNADNNRSLAASVFLLGGISTSILQEFGRDIYLKLTDWVDYYFNHKKDSKTFFYSYNKNSKINLNIQLSDFIMQKNKITQLEKFFFDFTYRNKLDSNKMLIQTENTDNKNFLAEEALFIKIIAKNMNLEVKEINISAINGFNIDKFFKTLRRSLKKNQFFVLNIDQSFQGFLFHEALVAGIINIFNDFSDSVICLKIDRNIKIPTNITKVFSSPILYYKISEDSIFEYLVRVFDLHGIKLDSIAIQDIAKLVVSYSYYEFLYFVMHILDGAIKNNNILTENIVLEMIKKVNIILNNINLQNRSNNELVDGINENNLPRNTNATSLQALSFQYFDNIRLNNIAGYDAIKEKLLKIIGKIKKDPFAKLPGLLLYGPPGTGKTKFMQAIASELGFPTVVVDAGSILDKYLGESEKNITNLFAAARKHAPCILLMDEIDLLLEDRGIKENRGNLVNQFISELDGVNPLNGVLIIGGTNRLHKIDPAVLRPGRIDKKILIDYPDQADREKIIIHYIETYKFKIDLELSTIDIAEQLDGFSGAAIKGFFVYIKDFFDDANIDYNDMVITKNILVSTYKKFKEENQKDDFKFVRIKDKKLNDIAGYDSIKQEMQSIIDELKEQNNKKTKLEGIILTGPPGTGKTNFARVLASESELSLLILNQSDIIGRYVGETEARLIKLFENIRINAPCIVFIDELESMFRNRENSSGASYGDNIGSNIINTFLYNIDGINALKGVLFIGATNFIDTLDPALIRPGRMSNIISIPIPQYKDRIEIIKYYIKKNNIIIDDMVSIEYLAERTNGMAPAEIEKFIGLTVKIAKKEGKKNIDHSLIAEGIQQMLFGKKNNDLIMSDDTIKQTAYHEAAHGVLQYILFKEGHGLYKFDFLTIEPRQKTLGVAYGRVPAEYLPGTRERHLGQIAISLAGKAAQKVFFNSEDSGAYADLKSATEVALNMIASFGMGEKLRVFTVNNRDTKKEIDIEVEKILQQEYQKVLNFITEHKELFVNIVDTLMQKKILYEKEIFQLINDYEKKVNKKVIYMV
jgi:ATP-dependent Zn protease